MAENLIQNTNGLATVGLEVAWKRTYIRHNLGRREILDKNPYRELVHWLWFCVGLDNAILEHIDDENRLDWRIINENMGRALGELQDIGDRGEEL